ncbi:MAG TPA: hypothetical protein VGJ96_09335 [Gemmatimonadaceae bacterium]|jgi:hypothetical protein
MKFANRWTVLAAALLLGVASVNLAAQGRSSEQRGGRGHKDKGRDSAASVIFRDGDRAAYQNYFATHAMSAKPLPPGIAKNLARGKPLPPGIAKRALPPDLLRIARPMDGVSYGIVGDAVVATRAGVIIDILTGVFK